MNDAQKYDGKENHANAQQSIEQTGENSPQTASSAAITENQSGESAQPAAPSFTVEGGKTANADPIAINLPFFLRWQVRDEPQTVKLLGAIDKVFHAWERSKEGRGLLENDFNQYMAYSALRYSFEDVIQTAATQRLGIFIKPKLTDYLFEPAPLVTNDSAPDPLLVDDPSDSTDVIKLSQWIINLQKMARFHQQISANQETIGAEIAIKIQKQQERIAELERQLKINEQAQKQAVRAEQAAHVPGANHYVDLTLYLTGGYESEVELVREVLAQASAAKLTKVLRHIAVDETEEAFFAGEEHTKLQDILSRLTQVVTEVAINNYSRYDYHLRPDNYLTREKSDHQKFMNRKAAFIDEYSVFTRPDDEEAYVLTEPEVTTDTTQEANGQPEDSH